MHPNNSPPAWSACELVFFDLETTGLTVPPDPLQVSAVTADGRESFDEFARPTRDIEKGASKVRRGGEKGGGFIHLFIYPFIHSFIHSFIVQIHFKQIIQYEP